MPGCSLLTPFSIRGAICERLRSQRGPHLAACEARRSSAPGRKKKKGAAEAVTAAVPTVGMGRRLEGFWGCEGRGERVKREGGTVGAY